ncbi:uncharacterized protein [Solanum lycopersicum]|uniref:Uncharacterized protein n=1 Tax=Solanum lycopersicum TaxID=4081 RepID=A0A3Q7HWP0_SOLLC|nr:uncharacterized protein LOC101245195 [Solanum lycopersicum]
MKAVVQETKNGKVSIKTECRANEEGRKHIEKLDLDTKNVDTVKYVEKKLTEKGVQRLERHPSDGLPLKHDPKKGHGGKYTWEGPDKYNADERDLNHNVNEEAEDDEGGVIVGEIEVAKLAEEGVARIEIDPNLKID